MYLNYAQKMVIKLYSTSYFRLYTISMSTNLTTSVQFVGKFDFAEGDCAFHPVRAEVRRVWVDVDAARRLWLGFATRYPFTVHILPPVIVCGHEIQ